MMQFQVMIFHKGQWSMAGESDNKATAYAMAKEEKRVFPARRVYLMETLQEVPLIR